MTDLTKIYEDFITSDVQLTQEFWDKQNRNIAEMQEVFAEKSRQIEYKHIIFNI